MGKIRKWMRNKVAEFLDLDSWADERKQEINARWAERSRLLTDWLDGVRDGFHEDWQEHFELLQEFREDIDGELIERWSEHNVYELKEGHAYIIRTPTQLTMHEVDNLAQALSKVDINAVVVNSDKIVLMDLS